MRHECRTDKWVKLSEVPPTDLFVCTYGGPFAQALDLDIHQMHTFLDIASLDGRVLLQESKVRRPQAIPDGINPDGSVAGRGSLRWGQKIEVEDKKINPYFQVDPDDTGWVVSINGNLLTEDLMERGNLSAREVGDKLARKINRYTRVGLREAALKDKCTTIKDTYKYGRIISSATSVFLNYIPAIIYRDSVMIFFASTVAFFNHGFPLIRKKEEESLGTWSSKITPRDWEKDDRTTESWRRCFTPTRLTYESDLDCLGLAFELDRLAFAYGYLDFKKYTGSPLIRAAG